MTSTGFVKAEPGTPKIPLPCPLYTFARLSEDVHPPAVSVLLGSCSPPTVAADPDDCHPPSVLRDDFSFAPFGRTALRRFARRWQARE